MKRVDLDEYTMRGLFRLVLNEINDLKLELKKTMSAVQDGINSLKAEVTRQTTEVASIKTLIDGFIAAAEDAKDDPAELQALLDGFKANTDALAAAVPANTTPPTGGGTTPAEPPAEPAPVEPNVPGTPPVQEPTQ